MNDNDIFVLSEERLEELSSRQSLSFDELCELAEGMTDRNLHIECRLTIAKWLKHKPLTKIYSSVEAIQDAEGHLPDLLLEYRNEKDKELNQAIRYFLHKEQAERLISTM